MRKVNDDLQISLRQGGLLRWLRLGGICGLVALVAACATAPKVSLKPCGVIEDSLKDVQGRTPKDTQRIDIHFERGKKAKCWT